MTFNPWFVSILLGPCVFISASLGAHAQPTPPPVVNWQVIDVSGSNPFFIRYVASQSVQANGSERSYLMKLDMVYPTGSVATLERGALANCEKMERLEIVNPVEWDSRPFNPVNPDTANARELKYVCERSLGSNPRFAVNSFPIPPIKADTKGKDPEATQ